MEFYRLLQRVRHLPVIERADWLWNALRKPLHGLLNVRGHGVVVTVGRTCPVRIPPEYCGVDWLNYEPETIAALNSWVQEHPGGIVIDIGCAIGIIAVVALSSSPQVRVLAIDSDLASLRATERVCRYAGSDRLQTLHGLIAAEHSSGLTLNEAVAQTRQALVASGLTGDVGTTAYRCLSDTTPGELPVHSLDGLLNTVEPWAFEGSELLIKCDVEGAELLVLQGARGCLKRVRPTLLLSVHSPALPHYGHDLPQLQAFLAEAGYAVRLLAVDHEEHWLCTPQKLSVDGRNGTHS